MVTSRRLRSKNEGTFLESVKLLLQDLKVDLAALKSSVEQMKNPHTYFPAEQCDSTYPALNFWDGNWNSWETWSAPDLASEAIVEAQAEVLLQDLAIAVSTAPHAKESDPTSSSQFAVHTRDAMLVLRQALGDSAKPVELQDHYTQSTG